MSHHFFLLSAGQKSSILEKSILAAIQCLNSNTIKYCCRTVRHNCMWHPMSVLHCVVRSRGGVHNCAPLIPVPFTGYYLHGPYQWKFYHSLSRYCLATALLFNAEIFHNSSWAQGANASRDRLSPSLLPDEIISIWWGLPLAHLARLWYTYVDRCYSWGSNGHLRTRHLWHPSSGPPLFINFSCPSLRFMVKSILSSSSLFRHW